MARRTQLRQAYRSAPAIAAANGLQDPLKDATYGTLNAGGSFVAGRHGSALQASGTGAGFTYTIPALSENATVTIGFAHKVSSIASDPPFLRLTSDAGATVHNVFNVTTAGAIRATRGTVTNIGTSTTGVITANTWAYIEIQILLADSGGFVTVRVNAAPVTTATSLDTKNFGTKTVYDTIVLYGPGAGQTNLFDDLYYKTGAGETFLGDITVPDP